MRFVLYCESELDNINDIIKAVEKTGKLSINNVYVSAENIIEQMNKQQPNHNKKNHVNHTPHIAKPKNNGWEEYDNITNMPTLGN